MRVVDFFVYYISTLYTNKKRGNLLWESPIRRTAFVVGVLFTMLLFSISQILCSLIGNINLIDILYSKIALIILGLVLIQILVYIYIKKGRFEYITSERFKGFKMSDRAGGIICGLIVVLSVFLAILISIIID
ncbi:hypothetical protein SAMN05428975_5915 [Mucilaginibacter sp. OK268]|jgi:hypothetical protein|nr:hypothetical protein SAMN05428975_5915 [Mucilaginibacter sp. OK268]